MKRLLFIIGALLLSTSLIFAQTPVVTQPYGSTSINGSTTIASTNVFQSIFAASSGNTGRVSCTVQNNGSHTMWVFFGPIANATKALSVVLAVGQPVYCNNGPVVLKDQVSITGTSGETFFAAQQ